MTPAVNSLFEKIRLQLESDMAELGILGEEDSSDAEGGDLGAVNPSDALEAFEDFLSGIADGLLAEFDIDEDEAIDFVFDVADDMAEEGLLDPMPEGDDPKALGLWIGHATSAGFGLEVMKLANEMADE